jgi:sporulation protein YlmC with PRC-barrel domain
MADNFLFFTELVSMPVFDLRGRRIGRVKDAALLPLVHASRIDRLLVGGGLAWLAIRFDQVRSITLGKGIDLSDEVLVPYHDDEYLLRIGRDLLDQQIIDVTATVVRVTITMGILPDGVRATPRARSGHWVRSIFRRLFRAPPPR